MEHTKFNMILLQLGKTKPIYFYFHGHTGRYAGSGQSQCRGNTSISLVNQKRNIFNSDNIHQRVWRLSNHVTKTVKYTRSILLPAVAFIFNNVQNNLPVQNFNFLLMKFSRKSLPSLVMYGIPPTSFSR
jgi:hypothetical protein